MSVRDSPWACSSDDRPSRRRHPPPAPGLEEVPMSPVKTLSFLIAPGAIAALILVLAISSSGGQSEPQGETSLDARDLASGMRALAREIEALKLALGRGPELGRETLPAASAAGQPSAAGGEQAARDLERMIE